jgi:hypothetical protein
MDSQCLFLNILIAFSKTNDNQTYVCLKSHDLKTVILGVYMCVCLCCKSSNYMYIPWELRFVITRPFRESTLVCYNLLIFIL